MTAFLGNIRYAGSAVDGSRTRILRLEGRIYFCRTSEFEAAVSSRLQTGAIIGIQSLKGIVSTVWSAAYACDFELVAAH
jgi:hypothetical protein